ncbi:hypothetical protein OJ598_00720 [Streptococcus anginosus]|uniref:Arsenate reductase n=4 Tax=Streptococcus TaxID=1301 RepID=A0AAP6ENK5_STRAP|nr:MULTISPECIES: arsenate reductase [Streptococcus]HEN0857492.1 hypothetical protein [Streptococcus agalactiae]ALL03309.1 hypothetical protein SanJ4211_1222c [Streptococcus anginosus]MBC5618687.1 hypothetical protein [Streptococcus hominis]MCW0924180.1 hypothetical protein [Streptococcus anginosus]MDU6600629.1 hypothetical protein [Streptococcus anginosus]
MLEIYLSRNTSRNQKLFNFCRSHDISYTCKDVGHLAHEDLLGLFAKTSDCFELLAPSFQRFKRQERMKLSELVTLVLTRPEQNLRLPLVVSHQKVYPDMSVEEARTFLPRDHKEMLFREHLFKDMTEQEAL